MTHTIPATIPTPTPIPASIPTPTPIPETAPEPFEHTFEEPSPVHQHFSPPQEQAQGQIANGKPYCQLAQEVKKLEGILKKKTCEVFCPDSEEEEPEAQGRKSQDDPLDSSVQGLVTPSTTKVNASGSEYNTVASQREGKAPMISEETPKKSKEQILQEEASLAEAIRLDSLQKEEEAKQIHLDSLLAQRIAETKI
ncbi:hypothetical protein Tco_0345842 [Tanacetum coccineum]